VSIVAVKLYLGKRQVNRQSVQVDILVVKLDNTGREQATQIEKLKAFNIVRAGKDRF
jgi:hypothetical protein